MMMSRGKMSGFTLIELLIVVAIIAILAAIAVPNFLEAQMRAKIGRCKADMRTLAMGFECYALDNNNKYPPHVSSASPYGSFGWANAQRRLTTPIAYMSSLYADQFQLKSDQMAPGSTGAVLPTGDYWVGCNPRVNPKADPVGHGDKLVFDYDTNVNGINGTNATWQKSYGRTMYKIQSFGPMRDVNLWGQPETTQTPGMPYKWYDPTNGTISGGLITRTQQFM